MRALPIRTPSLQLRGFVIGDAVRMMELNGEASTRRWLPSHVYPDAAAATARLQDLIDWLASPGDPRRAPCVLAVERAASGELLGHVGFSAFEGDIEVSYAIAESARGHGLGCEALRHACRWAAQQFDLQTVVALTEVDNSPSRRTLERAGFVHDEDTTMPFQGSPQRVSRYRWHRPTGGFGMNRSIALVSLVVRDYDEALAFFVGKLGFELVEDRDVPEQGKRWVVIRPPGSGHGAQLLLARASSPHQRERVGSQTGGRVFLFLYTDDFWRDHAHFASQGIEFVRPPSEQPHGTVAVFKDLYGNLWDLVQPREQAPGTPTSA